MNELNSLPDTVNSISHLSGSSRGKIKTANELSTGREIMKTVPEKCLDINSIGSFCDCIADAEPVDAAARGFCDRAKIDKNVTGDDLVELKKALKDLE